MSVFIINNEWTDMIGNTSSQVVDARYFESENEAWAALNVIAESRGTRLHLDETSLQFDEPEAHISFEEFYIQELSRL